LYYIDLYSALYQAAASTGYTINLLATNGNPDLLRKYLRTLPTQSADGLIICFLDEDELLEDFRNAQKHMPLVLLTSTPNRQEFNSVFIDAMEGEMRATQHLIDMGCLKIAFVGGHRNTPTLEKQKGFESAMQQNRLPVNPDFYFFGQTHFTTGFWAVRHFLTLKEKPDGIVCATDDIAFGCVKYLVRSGFKIPQDIKVIGFNGISLINTYEPSISSLIHPIKTTAEEAVHLMQELIQHPGARRQQIMLHTELLVNASTDPQAPTRLPVED
jgi:DNA-binding LacI/PurR family transcriptional regulator